MTASEETVLATIPADQLPVLLTALHRAGVGHLTRVLDPKRSPVAAQLTRAGIEAPVGFVAAANEVTVLVAAPARTATIESLVRQYGATATWLAARMTSQVPFLASSLSVRPRARRSGGSSGQTAS